MSMNNQDDLVNELLDDDALDPKKLFDEKQYNTLIINREGFNKKQNEAADLLEDLLDPSLTRAQSEEIFVQLKEMKAQKMLVDAIRTAGRAAEKAVLTAACWESGLDFSEDFLFFVELACHPDFKLAMEALTVVENCETVEPGLLTTASELIEDLKSPNTMLVADLKENIHSRTN